jgi:hypothetical protein
MDDKVRCPSCKGAKKVPKLGGMIGECNTCSGNGTILAVDKPQTVIVSEESNDKEILKAVASSVPASNLDCVPLCAPAIKQDVKVDAKKALYRRKSAAK